MRLLLHTCCGPCFLGVWEELGTHADVETELYYFNPNIHPDEEHHKRLKNLRAVAAGKDLDLHYGDYKPEQYHRAVRGKENDFPGRCPDCYRLRLTETAKKAKAGGFDCISTTLLVSPYQQHDKLKEIGEEIAKKYGLEFYYTDWRPHFRKGQNEAKKLDIYRQKYCGCTYSIGESKAAKG